MVYYRVQNATMSITNVEDSNRSTRLLAATTLRNVLGTKNLSEILSERETISHYMQVCNPFYTQIHVCYAYILKYQYFNYGSPAGLITCNSKDFLINIVISVWFEIPCKHALGSKLGIRILPINLPEIHRSCQTA